MSRNPDTGWATKRVWGIRRREKSLSAAAIRTPDLTAFSVITVPATLSWFFSELFGKFKGYDDVPTT
jgi:hypothetical protein